MFNSRILQVSFSCFLALCLSSPAISFGGLGFPGGIPGGFRGVRGYTGPGQVPKGQGKPVSQPTGWGTGRHSTYNSTRKNPAPRNLRPPVSDSRRMSSASRSYSWSNSRMPTDIAPPPMPFSGAPPLPFGGASPSSHQAPVISPHRTRAISHADLFSHGQAVRAAFNYPEAFKADFFRDHKGAWWDYDWWAWYSYWYDLYEYYCERWDESDCSNQPVEYQYGNTIKYVGNDVYYGNKKIATARQYFEQAQRLATSVPLSSKVKPKGGDWMPMGVFSLTQGNQTNSHSFFHLASNRKGVIRGNLYNPLTNDATPLQGKIDMKAQRAAWTVGDNKNVVYDTGLKNILSDQSTLLIHFAGNQTQQWDLVRMKKKGQKPGSNKNR